MQEFRGLGPPQFQEKCSWSERAPFSELSAEFQGILRAALGIQKLIFGIWNFTLGMASHDLSNTKTTILGEHTWRFSFALAFSQIFLNLWFAKPMVCVRVAFHENDGNHENDENDKDNSDSYKEELSAGFTKITETTKWRKPRESRVQTTGSPNHGFRKTRFSELFFKNRVGPRAPEESMENWPVGVGHAWRGKDEPGLWLKMSFSTPSEHRSKPFTHYFIKSLLMGLISIGCFPGDSRHESREEKRPTKTLMERAH